jgi:hypothetical protein
VRPPPISSTDGLKKLTKLTGASPTRPPEHVSRSKLTGSPCRAAAATSIACTVPVRCSTSARYGAAPRSGGGFAVAADRRAAGQRLQTACVPAAAEHVSVADDGDVADVTRAALRETSTLRPVSG